MRGVFSSAIGLLVLLIFGGHTLGLAIETAAAADDLFERDRLTGGWGGARKQWEDAGVTLGATDVSETLSNPPPVG